MVNVDFDPGSDNRIKIAADWSAKFRAVLISVAGWLPGRRVGGLVRRCMGTARTKYC